MNRRELTEADIGALLSRSSTGWDCGEKGGHVLDEDLTDFVYGVLRGTLRLRVGKHLSYCIDCLKRLLEIDKYYKERFGERVGLSDLNLDEKEELALAADTGQLSRRRYGFVDLDWFSVGICVSGDGECVLSVESEGKPVSGIEVSMGRSENPDEAEVVGRTDATGELELGKLAPWAHSLWFRRPVE